MTTTKTRRNGTMNMITSTTSTTSTKMRHAQREISGRIPQAVSTRTHRRSRGGPEAAQDVECRRLLVIHNQIPREGDEVEVEAGQRIGTVGRPPEGGLGLSRRPPSAPELPPPLPCSRTFTIDSFGMVSIHLRLHRRLIGPCLVAPRGSFPVLMPSVR